MKPGNIRCMDCRCADGSTCPGESPQQQAAWQSLMDAELGPKAARKSPKPAQVKIKPKIIFKNGKGGAT